MVYIDIIIGLFLAYFIWKGLKNGLIKELASVFALIAGIYLAIRFSSYLVSIFINKSNFSADYLPIVAFIVIFVASVIIVFLFSKILDKFIKTIKLQWVNKLGGIVFSIIKFSLILGGIFFFLNQLNSKINMYDISFWDKSIFYKPIIKIFNFIFPYTKELKNLF